MWDELFHACAFAAFITVAREQKTWPDSEKTRQLAYKLFEDEKRKADKPLPPEG
jgi:hypothetical protein